MLHGSHYSWSVSTPSLWEFLLYQNLLAKCSLSDYTFVCPDHILRLVSDTTCLGLLWTRGSMIVFSRNHVKAQDCSQLVDLHHLGGRNYLSAQHGILTLRNKTGVTTHAVPLSPFIVYHFPCDLEFSTQRTGLGCWTDRITTHIPLFTCRLDLSLLFPGNVTITLFSTYTSNPLTLAHH